MKLPNVWYWLMLSFPVAYLAWHTSMLVLAVYVFLGVAILNPAAIKSMFSIPEDSTTDEEKDRFEKAAGLVAELARSQDLKLTDADRAGLISEYYFRLQSEEGKDE